MGYSFTVIIPTYNSTKFIIKTINSVLDQSYKPDKIIIVDDNSRDQDLLKTIIDEIKKKRFPEIDLILNDKNSGPGHNRNLGWNKSRTDYVAFLDDDDIWDKDKLKIQLEILNKNKNISLVACKKLMINEKKTKNQKKFNISKISFKSMILKNSIPTSSVVVRTNIDQKFMNSYYAEDYYLWLSILKENNQCYMINDYLCEERKIKNKEKLSENLQEINKNVQNVLTYFYNKNLFNNLFIFYAKFMYQIKYCIKYLFKSTENKRNN